MSSKVEVGNKRRITATFTDPLNSDAATDPTAVYFTVKQPNGQIDKYTYGVGTTITKSSTGVYYMDVSLDMPGSWFVRTWSTGTSQAAEEIEFDVVGHKAM